MLKSKPLSQVRCCFVRRHGLLHGGFSQRLEAYLGATNIEAGAVACGQQPDGHPRQGAAGQRQATDARNNDAMTTLRIPSARERKKPIENGIEVKQDS